MVTLVDIMKIITIGSSRIRTRISNFRFHKQLIVLLIQLGESSPNTFQAHKAEEVDCNQEIICINSIKLQLKSHHRIIRDRIQLNRQTQMKGLSQ